MHPNQDHLRNLIGVMARVKFGLRMEVYFPGNQITVFDCDVGESAQETLVCEFNNGKWCVYEIEGPEDNALVCREETFTDWLAAANYIDQEYVY